MLRILNGQIINAKWFLVLARTPRHLPYLRLTGHSEATTDAERGAAEEAALDGVPAIVVDPKEIAVKHYLDSRRVTSNILAWVL